MFDRKWISIPAFAAGTFVVSALAQAAEPTAAELQTQINAMQAQLNTMSASAPTPYSAADVDAIADRVIADADQRAAFLQDVGPAAGYKRGFFIKDGVNSLRFTGQAQARWVGNFSDDFEESETGFEIRRFKLTADGTILSEDLEYEVTFGTNRNSGTPGLENAFLRYQFADDLAFRFGQWKSPVIKEESMSGKRQLAADRSAMNELIGGGVNDFLQGVALIYQPEESKLRAEVAFTDGRQSANTGFADADSEFGVYGRVDYLAIGESYNPGRDFSAMGTEEQTLIVGAGVDYTGFSDATSLQNTVQYTVDAQFENTQGLGLFGAIVGQSIVQDDTAEDLNDYGFVVQGSYVIPNTQWEPFARYDATFLDDNRGVAEDTINEVTVGANYYFDGHNAKMTIDATYLLDGYQNGVGSGASGIGAVNSPEEQVIIRGQFQLLI